MKTLSGLVQAILIVTSVIFPSSVSSAPISRDIEKSASAKDARETGGYFELGLVGAARNRPFLKWEDQDNSDVSWDINMGFQWHGLFVDGNDGEAVVLGYNLFNTDRWSYDLVTGIYGGRPGFISTNSDTYISSRGPSLNGGARATGFYDNTIVQFDVRQAGNDHYKSYTASAMLGRGWQVRNVNYHGVIGLRYNSSDFNDYYLGVRADEASPQFPEYSAEYSFTPNAEMGFTYPLTPHFLFKGRLNYSYMSDASFNSPVTLDGTRHLFGGRIALFYVF